MERYAFATLLVGAALLFKLLLEPLVEHDTPFLLFFAAMAAAAWRGGLGPGLLSVLLSAAAADYFFLPPTFAFLTNDPGDNVRLALFIFEGVIVVSLAASAGHAELRRRTGAGEAGSPERERAFEEQAALLEREREARAQAEAANQMKDDFLATLSHELRTPLSAIVGWAHVLRTSELSPEDVTRAVESIDRNARVQTQLISDLFDMSRIITGKLRVTTDVVALPPLVEAAVDTVRPTAEAKGVHLTTEVDPTAAQVRGDPDRLQQIVWNIVSNAVKFTPPGGSVQVRLRRERSQAAIVVEDTGVGITREFLPQVFDRFRQGSGTTKRQGGLGLGLAIVRHLVELHGGTVKASSGGSGQGATFTVSLPLLSQEEAAPAAQAPEPGRMSLDGLRVLVVDDDNEIRELLRTVLSKQGAIVTDASSAEDALAGLAASRPDVILSDLEMPEMDGYELIRQIRERPGGSAVPAAALTAYARPEDRTRALLAGYQMHVAKPVEPEELVAVVASLAGRT